MATKKEGIIPSFLIVYLEKTKGALLRKSHLLPPCEGTTSLTKCPTVSRRNRPFYIKFPNSSLALLILV